MENADLGQDMHWQNGTWPCIQWIDFPELTFHKMCQTTKNKVMEMPTSKICDGREAADDFKEDVQIHPPPPKFT